MKRSFDVLVKVKVFSAYAGPSAIYIMQKAQLLCIFGGATAFCRLFHEIPPPPPGISPPLLCFCLVQLTSVIH